MASTHALSRSSAQMKRTARLLERGLLVGIVLAMGAITLTAIGSELAARFLHIGGHL